MIARFLPTLCVLSGLVVAAAGCRGARSERTPIVPIRNMYDQPRYDAQSRSGFFPDQRTMRPQVPGTVAREVDTDTEVSLGLAERAPGVAAGSVPYVPVVPAQVIERSGGMAQLIDRGEQRYGIYCTPCHGYAGDGRGAVIERGMLPPPTFHDERIRHIPDGQLFAIISNGIRNMPAYRTQIPVDDRWAIVSYVRALQLVGAAKSPATAAAPGSAVAPADPPGAKSPEHGSPAAAQPQK